MRLVLVILSFSLIANLSVWADGDEKNEETGTQDTTWTQVKNITQLNSLSPKDSTAKVDTVYYTPTQITSDAALVSNPINLEEHLTQQPTIGLFKSMFVPGWGQVGNKRYLKAGIIIGLEGWLFSNAMHYRRLARDEKSRFESETDPLTRDIYYEQYLDRRAQRNKYSWFLGLAIFVSMFDAYVDAHLSGAPDQGQGAQLGFDAGPDVKGGFFASLSVRF